MSILPKTTPLVYTGETSVLRDLEPRFPPASPTEELAQFRQLPETWPYALALLLIAGIALVFVGLYLVALVNSHAFAVLAACLVAGFLWFAFGATRDD